MKACSIYSTHFKWGLTACITTTFITSEIFFFTVSLSSTSRRKGMPRPCLKLPLRIHSDFKFSCSLKIHNIPRKMFLTWWWDKNQCTPVITKSETAFHLCRTRIGINITMEKHSVAYLSHARKVESQNQPFLSNTRTNNGTAGLRNLFVGYGSVNTLPRRRMTSHSNSTDWE
jgi:hypothetical protein